VAILVVGGGGGEVGRDDGGAGQIGSSWRLQRDRCVLLYDNAPIHSAEADAFISTTGI